MKKISIYVDGMVCNNCENRIKTGLLKEQGIIKVSANFRVSRVEVTYESDNTNNKEIMKIIEKLGYKVISKPKTSLKTTIPLIILLFATFYLINKTVGFNFIPEITDTMGYGLIFVVGLLTSIHCIAMCGGVALSQSIGIDQKVNKFKPSVLYNVGRVISYTVIGGIVGGLGAVITPSGQFKGVVAILAGAFMLLLGLRLLNVFAFPSWVKIHIPKIKLKGKRLSSPFFIGLLNGFMPCGPLQTMQLYALGTGSVTGGALSMLFFSLGTVPLMIGFGIITSLISGNFSRQLMKVSGILVIVLGIIMLNRGLALSGMNIGLDTSKNIVEEENDTIVEEGYQIINLTIGSSEYILDTDTVKVGVPVKMKLNVESLNRCNNPILIPAYGIENDMMRDENIIEFIPTKEGKIKITCWMGMITTNLYAVDESEEIEIQGN